MEREANGASRESCNRDDFRFSTNLQPPYSGGFTPPTIQVGTILIEEQPLLTQVLGLECETYSGDWKLVKALDAFALDRKIHAAGWNFFFMAAKLNAMFFGAIGPEKMQGALQRILGKAKQQHFNALEVTGIVAKRFLGMPYTMVSAHSRHIQQSCYLSGVEGRGAVRRGAEWARG